MSQRNAFLTFKPSFISVGFGWPPKLFEEAFRDAASKIDPLLDRGNKTISVEGTVGAGESRWLLFGAIPRGGQSTSADLDGTAPYFIKLIFDNADAITSIKLTLFILNPRVILANSAFFPAKLEADGRFVALTATPAKCGIMLLAEPNRTARERREALIDGLPEMAAKAFPGANDPTMPVARIDLAIEWKADDLGKKSADLLGRSIGTPNAALAPKVETSALRLFSPDLHDNFVALLGASKAYALRLRDDAANGMLIVMRPPAKQVDRDLFDKALGEFNLNKDFKGLLFKGIEAHWLDDTQHGHPNIPEIDIDLTAVSFGGGGSGWYTSFGAKVTAPGTDGYLHLLKDARLSASLVDGRFSTFKLSGTFVDNLNSPWAWLAGQAASISLRSEKWKDGQGSEHEGATIDLALEAGEHNVLATLNKDKPVRIDAEEFSNLAVAMTLAPIVLSPKPVHAPDGAHPPSEKSRDYFVPIRGPKAMAQVFLALTLGWFFKKGKVVKVNELRVVGIRLQRQPIAVNDPAAPLDAYETALLFDYEVDYQIDVKDAGIKTARPVTARIDGTGFSVAGNGNFGWVQVPAGVRALSIADPSLWDLGPLGKFLRITDISLRRAPASQLVIRLHLNGNTDIVTTGDFIFVIPLEGDDKPRIEAFPSSVSIGAPGSLQATGTLSINGKDVAGSLEAVLPSGLRIYGALRVAPVKDSSATATIFSPRVTFATLLPLFGTGMGLRGVEGIFATHMRRVEPPQTGAVPPALGWLKSVDGDVVTSTTKYPNAWAVEFDRRTIGFGITIEPLSGGKLFSLNTMLAVEPPGPRILLFAKLQMLEPPKDNKSAAKKLDEGAIGIVDLDFGRHTVTAALLVEAKFSKLMEVRAPIELFFDMHRGSNWHLYVGRFDDPVSAKFNFLKLLNVTATSYLMASGETIRDVPLDGGSRDLPGFAVAFGLGAKIRIGPDFLYVQGGIAFYLNVSLSDTLYADGVSVISGEMRLFIVNIGASGRLDIRYLRKPDGTDSLSVSGTICGHYEDWWIDISGCIGFHWPGKIDETLKLPFFPGSVSIVPGADVSLHGQGMLGPIDAVIDEAVLVGSAKPPPSGMPLDAVIAIAMAVPPRIDDNPRGFAASAPALNQNDTRFQLGTQIGEYILKNVSLARVTPEGRLEEVDYRACRARWWQSGQSVKGGQPVPVTLALMTRDPLSVKNALASADQLRRWLDSIVAGLCDPAVKPQACLYLLGPADCGTPNGGKWSPTAILRDAAMEQKIGRTGASVSTMNLAERPRAGTPTDPLPGFPRFPGQCIVEDDSQGGGKVAFLRLYTCFVLGGEGSRVLGRVGLGGEVLAEAPIELLLAYSSAIQTHELYFTVTTSTGKMYRQSLGKLDAAGHVQELAQARVQAAFHENAAHWQGPTERFSRLANMPEYSDFLFRRIVIDLASPGLAQGEVPNLLSVEFDGDFNASQPLSLLIGGYKFIPFAEELRWKRDQVYKDGQVKALKDYLSDVPMPLLEPNSEYQVRIEWENNVVGVNKTTPAPAIFAFGTTGEPPRSSAPYLLATFPDGGEKFHSADDKPGFALGSDDALRILGKFPKARLKIFITENGGAEVWDKTHTIRWDIGRIYTPSDILSGSPAGIEKDSVASLPSKLREALQQLIDNKGLTCLGNVAIPNAGLWIGLNVRLRALTAYRVRIEIENDDGSPPWTTAQPHDEPFLEWTFSTALHQGLKAHVEQLQGLPARHRIMRSTLDLSQAVDGLLADKLFEEALANALQERSDRSGEARLTVIWKAHDAADKKVLKAQALLIESREPLRRLTRSVRIGPPGGGPDGDVQIAEQGLFSLQGISIPKNGRVKRLTFSTSGFKCLAEMDPDSSDDLLLHFQRYPVNRIPPILAETQTLTLTAASLASRISRQA